MALNLNLLPSIQQWRRRTRKVGAARSKCWILKEPKEAKGTVTIAGTSYASPHRVIFLHYNGYLPRKQQNRSVSHVCGDYRCINHEHYEDEDMDYNKSRRTCHRLINDWIDEMKALGYKFRRNAQYTIELCAIKGYECSHNPPCFIST